MYKTHHHSYDHWRRDIEQVGACRAHASFSGGAHSILCPSHRKTLCHGESNFTIEECEIKKPEKMDGKMHAPQNGYILYKYLYLCTVSRCWQAVHTKTGWFCLCVNIFLTPLHLMSNVLGTPPVFLRKKPRVLIDSDTWATGPSTSTDCTAYNLNIYCSGLTNQNYPKSAQISL